MCRCKPTKVAGSGGGDEVVEKEAKEERSVFHGDKCLSTDSHFITQSRIPLKRDTVWKMRNGSRKEFNPLHIYLHIVLFLCSFFLSLFFKILWSECQKLVNYC